jgi:phosphatidate cytidylyltransferase
VAIQHDEESRTRSSEGGARPDHARWQPDPALRRKPEEPPGLPEVHPRSPTPRALERPHRGPSNLTLRLLTAGLLIPPVIWLCYRGGVAFVVAVAVFNALGVNEFYNFITAKGASPHRLLGTIAAVLLPIVAYIGDTFYATSLLTAVLLTAMILQLSRAEIREAIASVSATFFGVFYVGWLLSHAVSVRFIARDLERRYGPWTTVGIDPDIGFFFMIFALAAAVCCDAGAYFFGRAYGHRKLAPTISPNKTVEGALGGILTGMVAGIATKLVFDHLVPGELSRGFPMLAAAAFGLFLASVAILGDLVESLLKRDAELKDAGHLLPGVGGLLDRVDSVLLAIPVTYYGLLAYYFFALPI